MIEWLREGHQNPVIELAGHTLPIELKRHSRAKRLTLRLATDGSAVRITMPRWCSTGEATGFAVSRREWLEEQLNKMPLRQDPVARGTVFYRGNELSFEWNEAAPRRAHLHERTLNIGGPHETLSKRLQRWLEGEALSRIEADLSFYCERADLLPPSLKLTRAKRRWGSCTSDGVLRVNWRLIQAPDFVRRSVVAHEVTHLVHFDHSPAFHAMLRRLYEDDIRTADGWLKQHGRALYADFG